MAHKLNIKANGEAAFFTVKETAWHGLGHVLDNCPTSAEAIGLAGLDYEVVKVPNSIEWPSGSGQFVQTPGSFSTVREDNGIILGDKLGNRYTIVQNRDAFQFFDAIVGEGEAIYETAGALGNGETIFITAKLPSYISVQNKDDIEKYLLLTMSHDGRGAIQAMFTPTRVVCNNTLNAALRGAQHKVSIMHTTNAVANLKKAHEVMGIANMLSGELEQIYDQMSRTKISDDGLKDYIKQVFLKPDEIRLLAEGKIELSSRRANQLDEVFEYAQVGPGQDMVTAKGTLFGAYNAVTGYFSNVFYDSADVMESANKRMRNNLIAGYGQVTMQKAMDLSLELIK
jgi:phage/plasmid-like protein (TIGR03299 family)